MLCITPRLWKITRSPSLQRCAYMVEGEYARRCSFWHMLLTVARSEVVVTLPVAGSRVCNACTQQPAICRHGSPVSMLRHTIYDVKFSNNAASRASGRLTGKECTFSLSKAGRSLSAFSLPTLAMLSPSSVALQSLIHSYARGA